MTWNDARNQLDAERAEREILQDPSLGVWGKARALQTLHNAIKQPGPQGIQLSDMARGAVGAGLGAGIGTIMGKLFGASRSTINSLQSAGLGLGSLLGAGVVKMGHANDEERRHAFRLGFVKAAVEKGLIKQSGFMVSPDHLLTPWRTAVSAGGASATNSGALLGNLAGMDATDKDIVGMELEQRELEQHAERLESQRRAQVLRSVLNRRIGR